MEEFPFVQFTESFPYEKAFYDVRLPSGEIVKHCWPNAGMMNSICGDGRKWSAADKIQVRRSIDHPEDKEHPNVVIIGRAPSAELVAQVQRLAAAQNTVVVLDEPMPRLETDLKEIFGQTEKVLKFDDLTLPSLAPFGGIRRRLAGQPAAVTNHDLMRIRRAEQKRLRKAKKGK